MSSLSANSVARALFAVASASCKVNSSSLIRRVISLAFLHYVSLTGNNMLPKHTAVDPPFPVAVLLGMGQIPKFLVCISSCYISRMESLTIANP